MDALQETLVVLVVVTVVPMVLVMFMVLTITRVIVVFMVMVLSTLSLLANFFFLGVEDGVVRGITCGEDVDLTRPRQFNIGLNEWHAKCVAESVGQAESFLAQRGSAEVATKAFVLVLGGRFDENYGTEDAGDAIVIAVYVGVCQRMSKANVGIRIGWKLSDLNRLSCNEADCMQRTVESIP